MSSVAHPPRVYVFVNGILTAPGDADGWTDRAVTWTQTRTPHKAEKWEYAAGALTRRLRQDARAAKIATLLRYYQTSGYEVVLVGHSNGCDIIGRVLALRCVEPWYFSGPVHAAHLFAPAADAADFALALEGGDLGHLHLYGSGNDRALQVGGVSRALTGWAGLGYGTLGLLGKDAEELCHQHSSRVTLFRQDTYGHSTWFEKGERFERTMLALHSP